MAYDTANTYETIELFGLTEKDAQLPIPEDHVLTDRIIRESFDALLGLLRGTGLEAEIEPLAHGLATILQRRKVALGKEVDRTADKIGALAKSHDGSEIAETALEEAQTRFLQLREIVGAIEVMSEAAAECYEIETGHAFIPAAEKSGIIGAIGERALRTACMQRQEWVEEGLDVGRVAVNLSPRQVMAKAFVAMTEKTLAEVGLDPHLLELEITEALFVEEDVSIVERLARLRRLGIRISMDDFGTGYSCLSRLTSLPIDALKVDRSLLQQASRDQNAAVPRAIVALARELGLGVTCEGVEDAEQVRFLQGIGCETIQGLRVSAPLPASEITAWLRARTALATSSEPPERPELLH